MKIGVIGAGSWGTALAIQLNKDGHEVTLWGRSDAGIQRMRETRAIEDKLPGVKIPDEIKLTSELPLAVRGAEMLILAVPSPAVRETARKVREADPSVEEAAGRIAVNVPKGLEEASLLRLSEVMGEELPDREISILSGPGHAEEAARSIPTALVSGSEKKSVSEAVQNAFMNEVLRVYTSPDLFHS